jgi:hypothetical protein
MPSFGFNQKLLRKKKKQPGTTCSTNWAAVYQWILWQQRESKDRSSKGLQIFLLLRKPCRIFEQFGGGVNNNGFRNF